MSRAYAITAEAIATERARVDDDLDRVDVSRIVALDEITLREVTPRDVKMRILVVSAEHNIAHAALADTVNIADARGGKIYPGNSAVGEVTEVGSDVTRFKVGDIVPHALQRRAGPRRLPAPHLGLRPTRLDRLVRRRSRRRGLAARTGPPLIAD